VQARRTTGGQVSRTISAIALHKLQENIGKGHNAEQITPAFLVELTLSL